MQWFEKLADWIARRGGKRELYRCGADGKPSLYMERFYLVKSKYFELMLHRFYMSDTVDVHDHPWASLGLFSKMVTLSILATMKNVCVELLVTSLVARQNHFIAFSY